MNILFISFYFNSEMENERRKSSRSTAIISNMIQQDKIGEKNLRKEIRKALKAEIKTEAQGSAFLSFSSINIIFKEELLKENARLAKIISRQNDQHELKKFKMTEQYDSDSEFETKIDSLVKLMRESKHCVIYTGAGISTAANIPDYRGKNGVWTSLEQSFYEFNGRNF